MKTLLKPHMVKREIFNFSLLQNLAPELLCSKFSICLHSVIVSIDGISHPDPNLN
jgi:hypothetical protein